MTGGSDNSRKADENAPAGTGEKLETALADAFDKVVPPEGVPRDMVSAPGAAPEQVRVAEPLRPEEAAFLLGDDGARTETGDEDDEEDEDDAEHGGQASADDEGDEHDDEGHGDEGLHPEDDPEEAARLAALASDLDNEVADEAPEGEIAVNLIDEDALKVVRRLHHFGYEAYLVGGCVRDLLLGRKPKDFDVATSAEPDKIRQIFRNCRLIGRRFRLAHIYFYGGKVIETSTFRANPLDEMDDLPQDLLISQDNVFGTSLEDARRRDFTVNALFYDPKTGKVVDHVGGRTDLDARVMRTIGDPDVRLREDPVRILRAVKFASRLGFSIDPSTRDAMERHAPEIARCAAPRVLEEIYRLLASGAARAAFTLLMELRIIPVLLPELAGPLGLDPNGAPASDEALELREEVLGMLGALDAVKERGVQPSHALGLGALFLRQYMQAQRTGGDPNRWLDDVTGQLVQRLRLTRRDRERLRVLMQTQRHLQPDRRRGGAARATVRRGPFLESLLLYTLHLVSSGGDMAEVGQWKAIARAEGQPFRPGEVVDRPPPEGGNGGERGGDRGDRGGPGGRRRRRRGRRGGGRRPN